MLRQWPAFAFGFFAVSAATLLFLSGCTNNSDGQRGESDKSKIAKNGESAADKKAADKMDGDHAHKPGAHGGIIVEIGRDNYHAEAVFEKGGLLKLYTLGKDEAKVIDVETQDLKAYVKEEGASESVEMELKPVPRAGDKAGRTSQFIGKLPGELVGKQLVVTIPIIVIDGDRFRLGFASAPPKHDDGMPIGVSAADEKELYLKPGGIYTEADIKANGTMTASQRFKGFRAKHDMRPKVGERICPVTFTKANPECWWIVNGKKYEFCCPPCVDEFVTWAKTQPDLIRDKGPESYVKK